MNHFLAKNSGAAVIIVLFFSTASARQQHPWPVTPFDESQEITGTFSEYRDTGSSPHFHNGADIPKADGSPVYPVVSGTVTSLARSGSNAFVRVGSLAYVHINPTASLSIGDPVTAGETVLGTIISGQGHVHFTDGFVGGEQNALRQGGGLTPYNDPWPPVIQDVRFYQAGTAKRFPTNDLSGPVTITFRVREANGPPGTFESRLNNGAYTVGYQVLSRDRAAVVHSPTEDGVVFRFDNKPSNSWVHNVFDPTQSSTSAHVYFITNELTRTSFLDTQSIPEGEYTLRLFAEDTRDNIDEEFIDISISRRDLIPPNQPVLQTALLQNAQPLLTFSSGNEDDLGGFRVFSSTNNIIWSQIADESEVTAEAESYLGKDLAQATYFFITAVDSVSPPNVSSPSDVYGVNIGEKSERILIVDGFDRTQASGSWNQAWHSFAFHHGLAVRANKFTFETCANEALLDGVINLADYDAVIWFLGDESTNDQTFSSAEQSLVKSYLENGGFLFVNGSEIGWDLEGSNSATVAETQFLHDYLKVGYDGDDSQSLTATGIENSIFDGLNSFSYGARPYEEDWPDYFTPTGGGIAALKYGNGLVAGVQYQGVFGKGTTPGKVVTMGFPFETISSSGSRNLLMQKVLNFFFDTPTSISDAAGSAPKAFTLAQNYPNPFSAKNAQRAFGQHPGTTVRFGLPERAAVTFVIHDILGREVRRWAPNDYSAGFHQINWDGRNEAGAKAASGAYFLVMKSQGKNAALQTRTIKMHLAK